MAEYEVTIGIPVYNIEKYIRQGLESALAQTFESIEFIVLDDCGTDGSMEIVREIQQHHSRGKDIRIVRQPQNMGIGEGRNRTVQEAHGRYLYFMDGDDTIAPNAIQLLYEALQQYNADIVYGSHMRVEMFDEDTKSIPYTYPSMQFLNENDFPNWVYRKYAGLQAMTWNFLINIDIYRKNSLKHKAVNFWEDFSFTIDLPTYVHRAVLLPDITYYYYCRYGSYSGFGKHEHLSKQEIQKTIDAMTLVKQNSDRIKDKPYFHKRMYKVMMTHFYITATILKERDVITPPFSNREIRDVMHSPLTFMETLSLKGWRLKNMGLYLLGVLPPNISVVLIRIMARAKGLI